MIHSNDQLEFSREKLRRLTRWHTELVDDEQKSLTAASVEKAIKQIKAEIEAYEAKTRVSQSSTLTNTEK